MSELLAFDAADPTISPAQMVAHGAIVAPVYIVGNPGGFQPSDARRVDELRAAGLAPWPNWERAADFFAHCSLTQAKAAGFEARIAAQGCGFPDDGSISLAFSFDYCAPVATFGAALDRLNACQDGLGDAYRATSYAQSGLIRYFGNHGFDRVGHWLMASTWGLSDYDIGSLHVAAVQSHHADGSWFDSPIPGTDVNTVTRPDKLGAWWPEGSEFAMPTAQEIAAAVWGEPLTDAAGVTMPAARWLKQARNLSDPVTLAKALNGKLPGLTEAQIEAAVRAVFADAGTP